MYYDRVLASTNDIEIQAKSYLSKAMIHYNNDDVNNAIKDYKFVISSFRNGLYFKQALMGLQSIYIGIAELYPSSVKIKKQMTYADNKGVQFVIMIGEDEMKSNTLSVKDMNSGEQNNLTLTEFMKKIS